MFLKAILDRKEKLFGAFSNKLTWNDKQKLWEEVYQTCLAGGCVGLISAEHLRKTTWQNLQRRTKDKYDRSKKTGEGRVKFNQVIDFTD